MQNCMETGTNRERLWAVFQLHRLETFDGFKRCRGSQPGLLTNPSKVIVSDIMSGKFNRCTCSHRALFAS